YFYSQKGREYPVSLLGPYDTTIVNTSDIYDQLLDLKFSFLANAQPCRNNLAGILLVIIVSTRPTNFANRMAIRKTWGKTVDSTKLVFLLGEADNITNQLLTEEIKLYGDIVQGNFIDAYKNLTYKYVMGLKWVTHHCPKAKYVLKTDDDIVVNIKEVWNYLGRVLSPFGAKSLINCHTYENSLAQRNENSKYQVTLDEYKDYYYPAYCGGWAIIYSQDVISKLLEVAQSISYFWIDDVQITGICAQKIGVPRKPLGNRILTRDISESFLKLGPNYFGPFLFGPPDLTIYDILNTWDYLVKEKGTYTR
ncbi:lactosylceramide 1,3-N-acetyl-beta-D-glucosaminyltransferase-like, partial [Amyelois transitella]|uniref:lactosylceramide 1,3-N-acetyl-beta-D-glucosaminyltransferase-like n=1 Tax=Amyelois transitella TaxID=680683 RepID=UPI0029903AA4